MSDINRQQRRAADRKLPPRHITERLAERAETTGCDRCGARFGDLLPYFITRTASDFSVRCGNCLDDVTTLAVGTAFTGGIFAAGIVGTSGSAGGTRVMA